MKAPFRIGRESYHHPPAPTMESGRGRRVRRIARDDFHAAAHALASRVRPLPPRGVAGRPLLYLIATRALYQGIEPYEWAIERAIDGGVGIVQMREKSLGAADARALALSLRALTARRGVPFVVNDDPRLARQAGADGVHVGQGDVSPRAARRIVGEAAWVGVSTHSAAEAAAAVAEGADMIGVGPIFATGTKPDAQAPKGTVLLDEIRALGLAVPAYPIGGITALNAPELAAHGFHQAAVSSWILSAPDPAEHALMLRRALLRSSP
jgi:thiamine-phosphate pyrophosphorylase